MIKKQSLIVLGFILLAGCGSGGGLEVPPPQPDPPPPIGVKGGKDGINVVTGVDSFSNRPTVRYLGEIQNNSKQPSCYISIAFDTRDQSGNPVGNLNPFLVNGTTLKPFSSGNSFVNSCLKPGETGSFDTGVMNLNGGAYSSFNFKICFKNDVEQCQFFPQAQGLQIPLGLDSLQVIDNGSGKGAFQGKVINGPANPTAPIPYNAKVHFTIRNSEGKIIDTALSDFLVVGQSSPTCSSLDIQAGNNFGCIGQGISTEIFTVETNTPFEELSGLVNNCSACYEDQIFRSECAPGGTNSCISSVF